MSGGNACVRHILMYQVRQALQRSHAVRHNIHLSVAAHFKVNGFGYHLVTESVNFSLDRPAVGWRRLYHAKVTCPHERELQCAWYWSGRHGQCVHIHFQLAQLFFNRHAKFLFLVNNKQSQVVPFYTLANQFVRPDNNVDVAFSQVGKYLLGLCRRACTSEVVHPYGEVLQTRCKRFVVLQGQHRSWHEHRHLFVVGSGLHGSAHGNFGFANPTSPHTSLSMGLLLSMSFFTSCVTRSWSGVSS